jgi:dolichol-phosphate mannosyltransferase
MSKKLISVVVPAFDEEDNVVPFHARLGEVLAGSLSDYELELIFVNDGSSDGTWARIRELADGDPRVKALSLSRNFGHQAALTAGLAHASGDAVITMDCDLQDPPDVIPEMVDKWKQGNQVVYARREQREDGAFKKATARLYYRLLGRIADVDIPRDVGDFRLLDRVVLASLLKLDERARYLRGMVAWLGFKHDFVDFQRPERLRGETHYSMPKMMHLAMDGLLNFTFLPLRAGLWIGLLSVLISVGFLLYMVVDFATKRLGGDPRTLSELYPLFKWLTVILFGFMGVQFIFLWIVGEYVGRTYNDVRGRPLYVVDQRVNLDPEEGNGSR